MNDLAVVVIASEKRRTTAFPQVLESVRAAKPDEIVVVADFPCEAAGVRSYVMQPMMHSTLDALMKRDIGTLATESANICYLSDDHVLDPEFVRVFRDRYMGQNWAALVPSRYCYKPDATEKTWLNVGQALGYVSGHCGIYRRHWVTRELPWAAGPHNLNWDLYHSQKLRQSGAVLAYADRDLVVQDIDLRDLPWLTDELTEWKAPMPGPIVPAAPVPLTGESNVVDLDGRYGNMPDAEIKRVGHASLPWPDTEKHEPGCTEPWVSMLVGDLVIANGAQRVLEIGAFMGSTTLYIAEALHRLGGGVIHVCELDIHRIDKTATRIDQYLRAYGLGENVGVCCSAQDSLEFLMEGSLSRRFDLAWVDGNHEKDHVRKEIELLYPQMTPGGLILLHDVYGSSDLKTVVQEFGGYSIDLPRLGPAGGIGVIQNTQYAHRVSYQPFVLPTPAPVVEPPPPDPVKAPVEKPKRKRAKKR